jgi:signal transduction histidine kinase
MNPAILVLLPSLCALLAWGIGLYIVSQKRTRDAWTFALLMFATGLYCGGYSRELASGTLENMLFWSKVQYVGIALIPALWLEYTLLYTGRTGMLKSVTRAALWIVPLLTIAFRIMDGDLGYIYQNVRTSEWGPIRTLSFDRGPWYYVNISYLYFSGLASLALLFYHWRGRMALHRQQTILLSACVLITVLTNLFYQGSNGILGHLDISAYGTFLTLLVMFVLVVRKDLIPLAPVARDFIVERLPHGVLIFDRNRILLEANESARAMLALGPDCAGEHAEDLLPPEISLKILPDTGKTSFETSSNGRELSISTYIIAQDGHERMGWVVAMFDVSERRRMEKRLEQMLAERTSQWREAVQMALSAAEKEQEHIAKSLEGSFCPALNALAMEADMASRQKDPDKMAAAVALVGEHARQLSSRARNLARMMGTVTVENFENEIRQLASRGESGAQVRCEVSFGERFSLAPGQAPQVFRIVCEALDNALSHASPGRVWLDFVRKGDNSIVTIANDGRLIRPGDEKSTGGMRTMKLRADSIGATLTVDTTALGTTRVRLVLPESPKGR